MKAPLALNQRQEKERSLERIFATDAGLWSFDVSSNFSFIPEAHFLRADLPSRTSEGLSGGAIAGIAVGCVVVVGDVVSAGANFVIKKISSRKRSSSSEAKEIRFGVLTDNMTKPSKDSTATIIFCVWILRPSVDDYRVLGRRRVNRDSDCWFKVRVRAVSCSHFERDGSRKTEREPTEKWLSFVVAGRL
jgi:hypothetical protein